MITKALELRDKGTFIALLAVDMNPTQKPGKEKSIRILGYLAQRYLLRHVGYPCDEQPNILITKLSGDGSKASNDPYYWADRTFAVAHKYIIEHWHELRDGDVVDVQFILGETEAPKVSDRVSTPL